MKLMGVYFVFFRKLICFIIRGVMDKSINRFTLNTLNPTHVVSRFRPQTSLKLSDKKKSKKLNYVFCHTILH